jgi:hypothetical protein
VRVQSRVRAHVRASTCAGGTYDVAQLGSKEELRARHATACERRADERLVVVALSAVEVAVAKLGRRASDRHAHLLVARIEDARAKPQDWHLHAARHARLQHARAHALGGDAGRRSRRRSAGRRPMRAQRLPGSALLLCGNGTEHLDKARSVRSVRLEQLAREARVTAHESILRSHRELSQFAHGAALLERTRYSKSPKRVERCLCKR